VLGEDDPRGAHDALVESISVARRGGYGRSEINKLSNGVEAAVELGEWEAADEMLARLRDMPSMPAADESFVSLGEALLAAYRGDHAAARAAMEAVDEHQNPMARAWAHRVRAVVLTQGGETEAGFDAAMVAIAEQPSGPNSPFALWSAGRAALWSHDELPLAAARIQAALDATTTLRGAWVNGVRASLEAALAGLEGRSEDALDGFAAVLKTWTAMQLPFDHAMTVGDAVVVLGPDVLPPGEIDEATTFLEGIGAAPLLSRFESAPVSTTDRTFATELSRRPRSGSSR